jgi:HAMP domain-containing protein
VDRTILGVAATVAGHIFTNEELSMTDTASHTVPEQGKFRRALATAWAFLQAMESGSSGYTLDRIEHLEREVGRLREELRQSRDPGAVDAHNAGAAALEQ